jgi:hypothetical protein
MSTGPATPSRSSLVAAPGGIRLPLDALKPFLDDLERPITFGDLQAAFGLGLHRMQKAVRVLRFAQLLQRRTAGRDPTPQYFLEKATVTLLTPIARPKLSHAKALECVNLALDVAVTHNATHVLSRVTGIAFTGTLFDADVEVHEHVDVEVTVAVRAVDTLVQDLDHLIRNLRRIHDRSLSISMVMALVPSTRSHL